MARVSKFVAAAMLAAALLSLNGCILIGAGVGVGVAHAMADESDHFDAPSQDVEPAARRALELVGGTYKETERTKNGVKVKGTLPIEDEIEKVVIGVWEKKDKPTKVEVRIGTFGYEDASKEILSLIGAELGLPAAAQEAVRE